MLYRPFPLRLKVADDCLPIDLRGLDMVPLGDYIGLAADRGRGHGD